MAGRFRGGRRFPTFDTKVELIPINHGNRGQDVGGYADPVIASYGEWTSPNTQTGSGRAARIAGELRLPQVLPSLPGTYEGDTDNGWASTYQGPFMVWFGASATRRG